MQLTTYIWANAITLEKFWRLKERKIQLSIYSFSSELPSGQALVQYEPRENFDLCRVFVSCY